MKMQRVILVEYEKIVGERKRDRLLFLVARKVVGGHPIIFLSNFIFVTRIHRALSAF
jgi:hypothetical protein